MKFKTNKCILICYIFFIFILLIGCGKKVRTEKEIKDNFAEQLTLKYNREFIITGLNTQENGEPVPQQYYLATCKDTTDNIEFTAHLDKDGTNLRDNFDGFYYAKDIEPQIIDLLNSTNAGQITDYEFYYLVSDKAEVNIDNYQASGNLRLKIAITIDGESVEEVADKFMTLVEECRKQGFLLSATMTYDNIDYLFYESDIYTITKEGILKELANTVGE